MSADVPGDADDTVVVGRIGPPHGIRGEVIVAPFTDAPDERFEPGSVLRTDRPGVGPLTVAAFRWQGRRLVVQFDGVDERAAAEALRGTELLIAASQRPALDDPDDFYDTDLVGLAAMTVDGRPLGRVTDVVHGPATDYLVIDVAGRDRLVPFVSALVPKVDLGSATVLVDPPEGLLDL